LIAREADSFGSGVALYGNSALIGACGDTSGATGIGAEPSRRDALYAGAAYLFAREGTKWVSSSYLKASNTDANDSFGFGVALTETTAAISAVWERSNATGVDGNQQSNALTTAGAVYVFE
jgi:trimeric autotransporter adhesin